METRFTDRIESAIREERRQAALRRLAATEEAVPGAAAGGDVADAGGNDVPPTSLPATRPAHRSVDQEAADDTVSTGTV